MSALALLLTDYLEAEGRVADEAKNLTGGRQERMADPLPVRRNPPRSTRRPPRRYAEEEWLSDVEDDDDMDCTSDLFRVNAQGERVLIPDDEEDSDLEGFIVSDDAEDSDPEEGSDPDEPDEEEEIPTEEEMEDEEDDDEIDLYIEEDDEDAGSGAVPNFAMGLAAPPPPVPHNW